MEEIHNAISEIECGKAPGIDNIFTDYLKHLGPNALKMMGKFFTSVYTKVVSYQSIGKKLK